MRNQLLIVAMTAEILLSKPAIANTAQSTVPSIEQLQAMCNADGGFRYQFGQIGVPYSSRLENDLGFSMNLPADFIPFQTANPFVTKWSGAMFEINYHWKNDDKEARENFMSELAAAIDAAGWQPLPAHEDPPMYRATYSGEFAWKRPREDGDGLPELYLAITDLFGKVTLSCARDDFLKRNAEEAFGKLPAGTPRPQRVSLELPPIKTSSDCAQPELSAELDAFFEKGRPGEFVSAILARSDYNERLTTWKMWRLEQSGKISAERLLEVGMRGLEAGSAGGNIFAHFALLEELFPLIDHLATAQKQRDRPAMCKGFVDFNSLMARMEAATMAQSVSTNAALDAEAKRLGVSFD